MKMNLFTKHCVAALPILAAALTTSCRDQEFDFEKMRGQNIFANYEQRFESLFGAIDPDQNWDFSDVELPSTKTRGVNEEPIYSMNDAISQEDMDSRWTDDWYVVESSTINKIISYLKEGDTNVGKVVDGKPIGSSFTLEVPDCGFKITPIFQGANDWHPTCYMTVTYTDEDEVTTSKTYRLWGEGEHLECIRSSSSASSTCNHCGGTGKVVDLSTELGELIGVYTIQNSYTSGNNRYYLNNKGAGTSSTKFAVIKDKSDNLHLYSLAAKTYLVANTDNGDLGTTSNINDASVLTYTSGGTLKLDNVYLYVNNNGYSNRGQLRKSTTSSTNTNYQWTWTSATTTADEDKLIDGACHGTKDCPACNGTGTTQWESAGTGRYGTTNNSYVALSNIRGNSLVFEPNDLPVGATIVFKTVVTEDLNGTPHAEGTNVTTGVVKYAASWTNRTSATNYYYSTAQDNNPYILALDIPKPSNITATTPVEGEDVPHEVMIIACEGGDNEDLNEVLFIIEGDPYLPRRRDTEEWRITESKRYMVEDMGYSDPSSEAVNLGYTDIDFNDIVVDFTKERKYKRLFNGTAPAGEEPLDKYRQTAVIRALGGTWDFILKVDGEPVFQKSTSKNTAQNITLNRVSKTLPPVAFNTNYLMYEGTASATALSEQGPLNYGIMYNTSRGGIDNVDGHFVQNLNSNQSYICTIVSDDDHTNAIGRWNPSTNNIEFVIYESGVNDTHFDSKNEATNKDAGAEYNDEKNVYNFGFPSAGATPKIIAFPNTLNEDGQIINVKEWKGEKVHVDKNWFPKRSN